MRKIIIKLSTILLIVIAFDWAYGRFACYLIDHAKGGDVYLDKYVCDSTKADLLIFGSSKAQNQYDPKILEDTLDMSVFNCGKAGMGIIYHYGIWKMISQRYVPKVVVYEILPVLDMMVRDDNSIFINPLRPYYGNRLGIDSIFWEIDKTERYKMYSKTYQYHSILDYISCYSDSTRFYKGFKCPSDAELDPSTVKYEDFQYQLDPKKWFFVEKFFKDVTSKTRLIVVVSPMYSFHDDHGGLSNLRRICNQYNVPLIDHFCDLDFVDNPHLYLDMAHLNRTGSIKWSKLISSELKQIINKK